MKVTRKQYQEKVQEVRDLQSLKYQAERNEDWSMYELCETSIRLIKENFFNKLETVCVSFMIGYRNYYKSVVKIGKSYYKDMERMTQGRGYRSIEEIPEITQDMVDEMISDSYYY